MNVHISTGNSKTGYISVNLLAGARGEKYAGATPHNAAPELVRGACGTCSGTCKGCYAMRMTRYPAVFNAYAENTRNATADPEKFVRVLEDALFNSGKPAPDVVRIHDSGDHPSYDYFRHMTDMTARHAQDTRFYGYTKEADYVYRYGVDMVRKSYGLLCSPWEGYCEPIGNLPQFIYDDGSDPAVAALPHCPAVGKDGKRTGITCRQCRWCAFAKEGEKRAVYAH